MFVQPNDDEDNAQRIEQMERWVFPGDDRKASYTNIVLLCQEVVTTIIFMSVWSLWSWRLRQIFRLKNKDFTSSTVCTNLFKVTGTDDFPSFNSYPTRRLNFEAMHISYKFIPHVPWSRTSHGPPGRQEPFPSALPLNFCSSWRDVRSPTGTPHLRFLLLCPRRPWHVFCRFSVAIRFAAGKNHFDRSLQQNAARPY